MGRFSAGSGDLGSSGGSDGGFGSFPAGEPPASGRWGEADDGPKPRRSSPVLWVLVILPLVIMVVAAIYGAPEMTVEERYRSKIEEGQRRSHDQDLSGAMEAFEEARTLLPDRGPAEEAIGTILLEQQRFADCEEWARKATAAMPESPSAHTLLGLARSQLGDQGEAASEYRTAIQVQPGYSPAYLNLGSLEARQGHSTGAIRLYERYLELDPGAEDADKVRENLARLRDQ